MIYLVTGWMRSGTSMMMGALRAGGLEVVHDPSRKEEFSVWEDEHYEANPQYWEPSTEMIKTPGFPRGHDGKLMKVLWGGLGWLAPTRGLRVVCMKRDPEEIRQSMEAFWPRTRAPEFLSEPGGYEERLQLTVDILNNRRDVHSVTVLEYADVVADPFAVFRGLEISGWPINHTSAAAHVQPELYRFRLEHLEVGI